jgi:hypothetical protein
MDSDIKAMFKLAIIGCGQLGSRHLQGLLKTELPISIDVVDESQTSIETAKFRASEIETKVKPEDIRYIKSIAEMAEDIDLCIVATSSNVRFKVVEELLTRKKVRNLVLEKVLFQSLEEYTLAYNMFTEKRVNCWVNCPRPMYDVYKEIQSKIGTNEVITYTATGGEWGLACNAIHFIDHISFLSQKTHFVYDHTGITSIIEGRRPGFVEFAGTIIGREANGSEIILHARAGSSSPLKIQILTGEYYWYIDEGAAKMVQASKTENWKENQYDIKIPYQSELTNNIVAQILLNGRCDLTTYESSMKLHMDMISSFLDFYNSKTHQNTTICPIT